MWDLISESESRILTSDLTCGAKLPSAERPGLCLFVDRPPLDGKIDDVLMISKCKFCVCVCVCRMSGAVQRSLFFLGLPDLKKLCCLALTLQEDEEQLRSKQIKTCRWRLLKLDLLQIFRWIPA